jgi:hypothetical protein
MYVVVDMLITSRAWGVPLQGGRKGEREGPTMLSGFMHACVCSRCGLGNWYMYVVTEVTMCFGKPFSFETIR